MQTLVRTASLTRKDVVAACYNRLWPSQVAAFASVRVKYLFIVFVEGKVEK